MKKSLIILSVLAAFLWSCDETEDPAVFEGPDFVAYDGTTATLQLAENAGSAISIIVNMSEAQATDTSITLDVANVNVTEGVNYTLDGVTNSTITIPAGEYSTSFSVTPIDDTFFNGDTNGDPLDRRLVFTLSSNSANLVNGHADDETRTVLFVDDDCPIVISDFVGTYTVAEMFTDGVNAPLGLADFFGEAYQLEFSLPADDPTNTKVIINNSAGFNTYVADGTVMTFNTCDESVTFDAGDPTVALFATFTIETTSYNDNTFVIQADGPLANFGPYQFIFTKQ